MISSNQTDQSAEGSPIVDFYRNKSIFITGASGFIGKVLVEKLLYSCPNLNKIYILLRSKKGQSGNERVDQEFIQCKLFERLDKDLIRTKIQPLDGDLTSENFGLSDENLKILLNNTNIVFHVAASVRFNDPLKECISFNVLGTKTILDLCHKMSHLDSLVHVSTAYAYCQLNKSEECLYPLKSTANQVIEASKWMDEETLKKCSDYLMEGRPNTYAYTKAVAEHYLNENRGQLPVAIARPSIVTASQHEPFPGWVDSLNGPAGASLLGTLGIARSMYCKPKNVADLIPIDIVTNSMIVIAWKTATDYHKQQSLSNNNEVAYEKAVVDTSTLPIYNITTGDNNPTTWKDFLQYGRDLALEMPSIKMARLPADPPKGAVVSWYGHIATRYFSEMLFAYFVDLILLIMGRKTFMIRLVKRMHNSFSLLEYFATRQWSFPCKNLLNLYDSLSENDQKMFDFDVRKVNWEDYTRNFYIGIRRHLLKESDDNVPEAKRRMKRLKCIYTFLNTMAVFLIIYTLLCWFPIQFNRFSIRN